jgi:hypothetical protein
VAGRETILRQVALVSYGTRFLRAEIALGAFAGHGLFDGIRSQFRDDAKRLVSKEFTQWLGLQREAGAQRLSLHLLARLPIAPQPATCAQEPALVVHFADRYQVWRCQCDDHERDLYWTVQAVAGELDVPSADWPALMAAVRKDLDIALDCPPGKPYFAPWWEQSKEARLPIFPYASALCLPHQLMEMLSNQNEKTRNDLNGKNENSYYHHLNQAETARVDAWARRLADWILQVQLCCANETRPAGMVAAYASPPPPPPPVRGPPKKKTARKPDAVAPPSRWARFMRLLAGDKKGGA